MSPNVGFELAQPSGRMGARLPGDTQVPILGTPRYLQGMSRGARTASTRTEAHYSPSAQKTAACPVHKHTHRAQSPADPSRHTWACALPPPVPPCCPFTLCLPAAHFLRLGDPSPQNPHSEKRLPVPRSLDSTGVTRPSLYLFPPPPHHSGPCSLRGTPGDTGNGIRQPRPTHSAVGEAQR